MLIALVALLILFNALFVLSEMALVSVRRARLAAAAERGDRGARAALAIVESPTRFLSTVQIGITLIGILLGAFGEAGIADRLQRWLSQQEAVRPYARAIALTLTVAVITFVSIVFGELVPKRLAQTYPEAIASVVAKPMRLLSRLAAPMVWALSVATDLVMALLPVRANPEAEAEAAEEEVRTLIASGAQAGVFEASEQRIVERVFNLSDRRVRSLMVPRPDIHWIPVDASPERVRIAVAASPHSHFPVCEAGLDDILGVVHIKDLVKAGLIAGEDVHVRDLMREPLFVPESTPALRLLDLFREERTHVAFVLDEYGVMEGLVTLNDVLSAIVGDVTSHGEPVETPVVRRDDGSYLVDGMIPIGDLKELIGVSELPKERELGFETLGGFVMSTLGRIPTAGDKFPFDGWSFEVMDMDKTRVDKVLVAPAPVREPPGVPRGDEEGE